MSTAIILGLGKTGLTDSEIMKKIAEARMQGWEEIEFSREDGVIVKIKIPPKIAYDPFMEVR